MSSTGMPLSLASSTLFGNCATVHLVNDISSVDDEEYTPSSQDVIDAGSTSYRIVGWGRRTIFNILDSNGNPLSRDLVLTNVAFVPDFHTNFVSMYILQASLGAWYCAFDATLRVGTMKKSSVLEVAQMVRNHNLTFLEYKPISFYSYHCSVSSSKQSYPTIHEEKSG